MSISHEKSAQIIEKSPEEICSLEKEKKCIISETQALLWKEKMQNISNADFLKIPKSSRLKNITEPSFLTKDIVEKSEIIFSLFEKENRRFYLKTTAWQVLPDNVGSVLSGWISYSRSSVEWEFFSKDGKRLIIHDKTKIQITDIRSSSDMLALVSDIEKQKTSYLLVNPDTNSTVLSESIGRGFDPKMVLSLFATFFAGVTNVSQVMQEDFFTQMDREIWKMNVGEKKADKYNLTEVNIAEISNKMDKKIAITSLDHNYHEYPELSTLWKNLWITNPEFLYAFWSVESTCGADTNERYEAHLNTSSIGMFQILKTNLKWHPNLVDQLSKNPTDKSLNYQALGIYLSDNPSLITAINNYDIHEVSSIYNGPEYKKGGYHIKLQKALHQYNNYKNMIKLDKVA